MAVCLIIDDEVLHREIDLYALNQIGIETQEASGGRDALIMCNDQMPDIILLDLVMPEMNGIEFLTQLRTMEGGTKPFVLVCSANGIGNIEEKVLAAGADSFLLKPFSSVMLKEKLGEAGMLVARASML